MRSPIRFLDDAARLAQGALGTFVAAGREAGALSRAPLERVLSSMDLVKRHEFEAAREMAANARAEQEQLTERIAALEAALAAKEEAEPAAPAKPGRKRTAKAGNPTA